MAKEQILMKGLRAFAPHSNAPDFVKASVVLTLTDVQQFFIENPTLLTEYNGAKQIRLQLLESKDGKPYFAVDSYKPGDKATQGNNNASARANGGTSKRPVSQPDNGAPDDDLPF